MMWIKKAIATDVSKINKCIDILLCYEGEEKYPYQLAFEVCQKSSDIARKNLPYFYFNGIGTEPNYMKGLKYLIEDKNEGLRGGVNTNRNINAELFEYDEITIVGNLEELMRLICITMQYNLPVEHYCMIGDDLDLPSFFGSKISFDKISSKSAIISYYSTDVTYDNIFFIMPEHNERELLLERTDADKDIIIKSQEEYNNLFHKYSPPSILDIKHIIVDVISLANSHMYVFRKNTKLIFKSLNEVISIFNQGQSVYKNLNPNKEYIISYDIAIGDQFRQLSPRIGIDYVNKYMIVTESASSLKLMYNNTISISDSDHICLTTYLSMSRKLRNFFITGYNSIYPGISWKSDFNNTFPIGNTRLLKQQDLGRLKCYDSHIKTYNSARKPNPKNSN